MASKVSRDLADEAGGRSDSEAIELVVELRGPEAPSEGTRSSRIADQKLGFGRQARAVGQLIRELGGEVVDSAWINQTLRIRLPKRALENLASDDRVALLDSPRAIEADE